jgi:hypothetical protein
MQAALKQLDPDQVTEVIKEIKPALLAMTCHQSGIQVIKILIGVRGELMCDLLEVSLVELA